MTQLSAILEQIDNTDPAAYGKTRNFIDGAVTRLSPYISRGVISTRFVFLPFSVSGKSVRNNILSDRLVWKN